MSLAAKEFFAAALSELRVSAERLPQSGARCARRHCLHVRIAYVADTIDVEAEAARLAQTDRGIGKGDCREGETVG